MAAPSLALRDPTVVRHLMRRSGLDGKTLATAAGVTKQFFSLMLRGQRRCNPTIAAALADALDVPQDALFFNTVLSDSSNNAGKEQPVPPDLLAHNEDPYLYFDQVATLVNIPVKTLRQIRLDGDGPDFFKRGQRLMIRKSKALAWMSTRYENADSATTDA